MSQSNCVIGPNSATCTKLSKFPVFTYIEKKTDFFNKLQNTTLDGSSGCSNKTNLYRALLLIFVKAAPALNFFRSYYFYLVKHKVFVKKTIVVVFL